MSSFIDRLDVMSMDYMPLALSLDIPMKREPERLVLPKPVVINSPVSTAPVPMKLVIEPTPQIIHSPYVPGVAMKPNVLFDVITLTEQEVMSVLPDVNNCDALLIIRDIEKISMNSLEKTIPNIGIQQQESLALIPEKANSVIPKNGVVDQSLNSLDEIKELVESIRIKKDESFIDKLFAKKVDIADTKKSINDKTKTLKIQMQELEKVIGCVDKLESDLNSSKYGLLISSNTVKVLKNKIPKHQDLLDSRFSSLYISLTIAEQTRQLLSIKTKNIRAIIAVIRDTLLTSIPSWFNSLEILEQMEVSNALDQNLIQSLLTSQDEILKQLSINSKKENS